MFLYLIGLVVTLICLALMIILFPMLLKLKPIKGIKYLEVDSELYLKLNEELSENFEAIKLIKNEDGLFSGMVITPKENVTSADLTFAGVDGNNAIKIKGFKLKFKFNRDLEVEFKQGVRQVALYVNQINDGVIKQRAIQQIKRSNAELFVALEWVGGCVVSIMSLCNVIVYSAIPEYGTFHLPVIVLISLAIAVLMYFVIHYVTFWYLGKYIYGGLFDDARN